MSAVRRGPAPVRLTHEVRGVRGIRMGYGLENEIDRQTCLRDNSANALPAEPHLSILL